MSVFQILYGKGTLELRLPEGSSYQLLEQRQQHEPQDPIKILREALNNPIGGVDIRELTKTPKSILIITNDCTRPMPSHQTIPALIESFYLTAEHYDITILIATGLHRMMTKLEIQEQLGREVADNYRVVVHEASDASSLASFGMLSSEKSCS